jgi:hypothetical protein
VADQEACWIRFLVNWTKWPCVKIINIYSKNPKIVNLT